MKAAAVAVAGLACRGEAAAPENPAKWDREADVVLIGAGATGLPAVGCTDLRP